MMNYRLYRSETSYLNYVMVETRNENEKNYIAEGTL